MVEYIKANIKDKADIIDFINYVFSQNGTPHDFKKLAPKSYADHINDLGAEHYMVKDDGRIKAIVANRIVKMNIYGHTLTVGLIGNVAVHPYSRGNGYMSDLLNMAIEDAKTKDIDILALGGQRQRYGYFGFEPGGYRFCFRLTDSNIRHALTEIDVSDIRFSELKAENTDLIDFAYSLYVQRSVHTIRTRESFLDIVHSWNSRCRIIYKNSQCIGYILDNATEIVLLNESDFPEVLKALFLQDNIKNLFRLT